MSKQIQFLLILLFAATSSFAQSVTPWVIANDGGVTQSQNMIIEWTIGEPMVETNYVANELITEGFHQPTLQVAPFGPPSTQLGINIYPNPVQSIMTIDIQTNSEMELTLDVQDLHGKSVLSKSISAPVASYRLDISNLATSVYLLRFTNKENQVMQTYKVWKTN